MMEDKNVFLGETDKVKIRLLIEDDKGIYRAMSLSRPGPSLAADDRAFNVLWGYMKEDTTLACTIVEKATNNICGFCQLSKLDTGTPEVSVDIIDGYMGNGYAFEATELLMQYAALEFPLQYFVWCAYTGNSVSRHLAEKHGGVFVKEEPFLPDNLLQFALESGAIKPEDINYICTYHISKYCNALSAGKI